MCGGLITTSHDYKPIHTYYRGEPNELVISQTSRRQYNKVRHKSNTLVAHYMCLFPSKFKHTEEEE